MQTKLAAALLALAFLIPGQPDAKTKVDEGFASTYETDGRFGRPTNTIKQGVMGQEVVHWIEWKDHPVGASTFRCVVKYESDTEPVRDETISYSDSRAEGWSICGIATDHDVHPDGTYHFAQYLNGEVVGEGSIKIKTRFLDRILNTHWSVWLILVVLGAGLLRLVGKKRD